MDETTATILFGCQLARNLEANLENVANQPEFLWRTCDEIIRVFSNVKERISISYPHMVGFGNAEENQSHASQQMEGSLMSGIQQWLRTVQAEPAMDLLGGVQHSGGVKQESSGLGKMVLEMGGRESEVGRWLREHVVVAQPQPMPLSGSARASSSSPRPRRRKDEEERRRVIVAAPLMGNTDTPPEDGYGWRKYGQKDILNSNFPRCTHQKLYNCPAKKLVQRLDDDPTMFEVIYRGKHTCHLSTTAPSVPPPPTERRQDILQQATNIHPLPPSHTDTQSITHWLSMDTMRASSRQAVTSPIEFSMQMGGGEVGGSALAAIGTSAGGVRRGGPSSSRYVEDQPVANMADAMFNSGSSSNNSMDLIFSSMEDKWESGERKDQL